MLRWDDALDNDTLLAKPYREIIFTADQSLGYVGLGSWIYHSSFSGSGISIIVLSNSHVTEISATYMRKGLAYSLLKSLYSPEH